MNIEDLKKTSKIELITKKELLNIIINDPDLNIDNFKKKKVLELRELLKITHKITTDNKINYVNNYGHCFSCLMSLRHDYTSNLNKNYCQDCL